MYHDDQGYMLTITTFKEFIHQNYLALIASQNHIPKRVATALNAIICNQLFDVQHGCITAAEDTTFSLLNYSLLISLGLKQFCGATYRLRISFRVFGRPHITPI